MSDKTPSTGQVVLNAAEYASAKSEQVFESLARMFDDGAVILLPRGGGDATEIIRCALEESFKLGAESVIQAVKP